MRELAAFREIYAQERNVPRNRVYKDDALVELGQQQAAQPKILGGRACCCAKRARATSREGILAAVNGRTCPPTSCQSRQSREKLQVNPALADLLRVLLKAKTESAGVAAKLIAPAADLDALAAGVRDVPALSGWRAEVFGQDALRLCEGKIALAAVGSSVKIVDLD